MSTEVDERAGTEARGGLFDASGSRVESRTEVFAAPEAVTAIAKLTLHNGATTFEIEARYNPNSYPFLLTGGQITSGICGAPWNIVGGHLGADMRLTARRAGAGSCADTITVVGEFAPPAAYRGTYGFNGASSSFKQTLIARM